jgi:hypothetical protein
MKSPTYNISANAQVKPNICIKHLITAPYNKSFKIEEFYNPPFLLILEY